MTHSDVPTYHVPPADGVRIADPGRWWRCLLIMILGAGTGTITTLFIIDIMIMSRSPKAIFRWLLMNEGSYFGGVLYIPCMALIPIIALALIRNMQAWRVPTLRTVAQANRWIRRLGWAFGWAVLAGIAIIGWLFYWSLAYGNWGLILYRVF